jgi:hypothetical protein
MAAAIKKRKAAININRPGNSLFDVSFIECYAAERRCSVTRAKSVRI